MANPPKSNGGIQAGPSAGQNAGPQAGGAQPEVQVRILNQYIRDLSFENPSIGKPVLQQGENPNLQVEINVNAQPMGEHVYESAITLKADCKTKGGAVVYDMELVYGALFEVRNLPEQALEAFLLVNCPALIFPFARRVAADITREGGFPPLLLDPIDFGQLYMRRRQEMAAQEGAQSAAKGGGSIKA